MASALTHITTSMQLLSKLAPGGTPNASEQTLFLALLNGMLESWTMRRLLGAVRTITISGKQTTVGVSGSVTTLTDVGGTETTTVTPVTVTLFASTATSNTYPTGWDQAIQFNLALVIASTLGVKPSDYVTSNAQATLAAITPPEPTPTA